MSDIKNIAECLPVMEAAEKIGVHHTTLRRMIDRREVKTVELFGRHFLPPSEVERLKREAHHA
jgi:excisionase family DNA binding protein